MIEKEDLTEQGIEADRTDANGRDGIVAGVKGQLRDWYATLSKHRVWAKHQIEGAIVASLTIPSGIDVLAGHSSVALAYGLMLLVLLGTTKVAGLSRKVRYLDGMSSRVGGFLSTGALVTGAVAVVGFGSPTVVLVQTMATVWAVIWLAAMWTTTLKGMLREPTW